MNSENKDNFASTPHSALKVLNTLSSLLFYCSILFFIIGFNINDTPAPGFWYQQFMPNLNEPISDVVFLDSLTGYAVTGDGLPNDSNYILKTTNGGNNWQIIYTAYKDFFKIKFINQLTGFVCGGYNALGQGLLKTTNGGNIWSIINAPFIVEFDGMDLTDENNIWLVSTSSIDGGVFYTSNGGLNWIHQLNIFANNPDRIYMYNARIGFVGRSSNHSLYRTLNGGINWSLMDNNEGFNDMYFIDSLIGWKSPPMKKTTNGGLNWVTQILPTGGGLNPSANTLSNINKDTIWVGGGYKFYPNSSTRGLLNFTSNGGDTWYFQIPDTSFRIPGFPLIQFINKLNGWAYGYNNTGIHTTTGGDTTFLLPVHQISSEIPKEYKLYQNYPNPFNPKTMIKYQITVNSYVSLKVFDITGKYIINLVNKKQPAGTYETEFNGSGISSGVYFYSLIVDGVLIDTKKLILIK